jgi:hypothetical protein
VDPGDNPVAVFLAPKQLLARDLARANSLVEALGWPVLGVITYESGRRRLRRTRGAGRGSSQHALEQSDEGEPVEPAKPVEPVKPVKDADADPVERPNAVDGEGGIDRVENEEVLRR